MKKTMLDTAMNLMQRGLVPSVTDVAEAAQVSRATAYRYFPSQAAMIHETVDEALGPILDWRSDSTDARERVSDLLSFAYPRIDAYEATHRATLFLAIDQWIRSQSGTLGEERSIKRGHRRDLLADALQPLRSKLGRKAFDRLAQSLSLIFGAEALIVLKDIWGLDAEQARKVAVWAADAMVCQAIAETTAEKTARAGSTTKKAASRPRRNGK
jgi:AcrR family transcriptional regulator